MGDLRDPMDRVSREIASEDDALARVHRRAVKRQMHRRVGAGLAGVAIATASIGFAFAAFRPVANHQLERRPGAPPGDGQTLTYRVPSESMQPTYAVGDVVEVDPAQREPKRGNVILFSDPKGMAGAARSEGCPQVEQCFMKRVIGLAGETIEIRQGRVFVDGNPLSEPYALLDSSTFGPITVPAGTCFVMGDNRANSSDSRSLLGAIPEELIIGTVVAEEESPGSPVPGPTPTSDNATPAPTPIVVDDRTGVENAFPYVFAWIESRGRGTQHGGYDLGPWYPDKGAVAPVTTAVPIPVTKIYYLPGYESEAARMEQLLFPGAEIGPPPPDDGVSVAYADPQPLLRVELGEDFVTRHAELIRAFNFV